MRRAIAIALVVPLGALAACEGEPPVNYPENPQTATAASASAAPAVSASVAPVMPAAAPMPAPMMMGSPMQDGGCMGTDAGAPPATPEGAETAETSPAVPPPEVARGNIVGAITTRPPGLVANAIVYLEDAPKEDVPAHLQTVTINNVKMNFVPYVAVAAVGAKVLFVNSDPFPHNVFSPDNDKFNLGNIPQSGARQRVFEHPGVYSLLCNLHPGMLGYLVVTPSTHFARVDAKGKYELKHVPAGTYQVTSWAPHQTPVTQPVTVGAGDVTLDFQLKR